MNESAIRRKRLTIVVPVYFNEENLPDTIPALLKLAEQMPAVALDIVFVDDGSGDNSFAVLRSFQQKWPQAITIVRLSRNFGSMNAILAGLQVAEGDCVGMLSADLQDPPELLKQMYAHWLRGTKAVLAVREAREDEFLDRLFAAVYYRLLRKFALQNFPQGGFDCWLLDRQVVEEIKKIREKNTSISSLIIWLGYQPVQIPYVRRQRTKGKSRWTMAKKIKLFIDSFASFSYFPIRFVSVIGFAFAGISFLYATGQFVNRLWFGTPVPGFASIVILITFTSGLQMIILGTLGEYLWRTLDEARNRPPYVIDAVYSCRTEPLRVDSICDVTEPEPERKACLELTPPFFHAQSLVDKGAAIGDGTRVWAFAHVAKGAVVGKDCNLCDHTFFEGGVVMGDRVTVKSGVFLWQGVEVEDDVFIGPRAGFTNDLRPRSKQYPPQYLKTVLRQGCSIGANATILCGLAIGRWAIVGAGSVVTRDVPDYALVTGNPGRFKHWVCRCTRQLDFGTDRLAHCTCGRRYRLSAPTQVLEEPNGS